MCTLLIKGWARHILGILIVVIPQILNLCPTFLDKAFEELAPNVAGLIVGVSWLRIRCIFQRWNRCQSIIDLCHLQIDCGARGSELTMKFCCSARARGQRAAYDSQDFKSERERERDRQTEYLWGNSKYSCSHDVGNAPCGLWTRG